jgi:hypothetical protein
MNLALGIAGRRSVAACLLQRLGRPARRNSPDSPDVPALGSARDSVRSGAPIRGTSLALAGDAEMQSLDATARRVSNQGAVLLGQRKGPVPNRLTAHRLSG